MIGIYFSFIHFSQHHIFIISVCLRYQRFPEVFLRGWIRSVIILFNVDWHSWLSSLGSFALELDSVLFFLHEKGQNQTNYEHSEAKSQASQRLFFTFSLNNQSQADTQDESCKISHSKQHAGSSSLSDREGDFTAQLKHDGNQWNQEKWVKGGNKASQGENVGLEKRVEQEHSRDRTWVKIDVPIMQIRIHFLYFPDFLCIGPIIMTPMMPEMTGLPPTHPTAMASSSLNHGASRKDKIIERPLKIPK